MSLLATLTFVVGLMATSPASAWSTTVGDFGSRTAGGSTVQAYIYSEAWNWGCGLSDCASADDMYGWTQKQSGNNVSKVGVRLVADFSGIGVSVSVSTAGTGAFSVVPQNDVCQTPRIERSSQVWTVDYLGQGEICKASTLGAVCSLTVKNSASFDRGTSTYFITNASRYIKMGCF